MRKVVKYVAVTGVLIPIAVLTLMVLADIVRPYKPPQVELTPADFHLYPERDSSLYWDESAHALGVHPDSLTVEEYLAHSIGGIE